MLIKKIPIFLFLILFIFSCKTYNIIVDNEKKTDGTYEMFLDPEIFFANKYLFYYQLIYKYPEDFFYMKIYPEDDKISLDIQNFTIKNGDNTNDLQVFKQIIKNQKKSKNQIPDPKLIKIDYPAFNIIKDENKKIFIIIKTRINNQDESISFLFENYDKIYLQRFSNYIDDFKLQLSKKKK